MIEATEKIVKLQVQNLDQNVDHPQHYNVGTIETIDYLRSVLGNEGCYDFCAGNILKYVSRAKHKGKPLEDLKKAECYLQYAMKLLAETGATNS